MNAIHYAAWNMLRITFLQCHLGITFFPKSSLVNCKIKRVRSHKSSLSRTVYANNAGQLMMDGERK